MPSPSNLKFTDSHEWFRVDHETVTVGITQYAANELTDVTYVQMKAPGTQIDPGTSIGEVESVKTTSDVYSVVGGSIVEVNDAVSKDASLVNSDPYGKGWLVKLKATDISGLQQLMDASSYDSKHPIH
ncbi:MAG: glycine cleavage system protein GcvH [Phycisphaerales bacterium]|nr:glycine cleavage system protein GcvH [Phycisphaerales bacterium]